MPSRSLPILSPTSPLSHSPRPSPCPRRWTRNSRTERAQRDKNTQTQCQQRTYLSVRRSRLAGRTHNVLDLFLRPSVRLSVFSFLCLLPTVWTLYFENERTDFNANWHKSFSGAGAWTVDLGVRRSKVNVTGGWSYVWKPGGDIILDPLSRVDRGIQWVTKMLPLKGDRRGVAHSFNAPAYVVPYASCWRTCFISVM